MKNVYAPASFCPYSNVHHYNVITFKRPFMSVSIHFGSLYDCQRFTRHSHLPPPLTRPLTRQCPHHTIPRRANGEKEDRRTKREKGQRRRGTPRGRAKHEQAGETSLPRAAGGGDESLNLRNEKKGHEIKY